MNIWAFNFDMLRKEHNREAEYRLVTKQNRYKLQRLYRIFWVCVWMDDSEVLQQFEMNKYLTDRFMFDDESWEVLDV